MTTHHLKTWPVFFDGLVDGTKTAEVRFRDRGFQVGDTLILQEFDPMTGEYTPRLVSRVVSRVDSLDLLSDDFPDYVLLSFRDREEAEASTAPTDLCAFVYYDGEVCGEPRSHHFDESDTRAPGDLDLRHSFAPAFVEAEP